MQGNKRRDTGPELAVRRLLHTAGLRYRVDHQPLPSLRRRADIAFTRLRVAVFIDGCYWHGCSIHRSEPRLNASYWNAKITANQVRDEDTNQRLTDAGWLVLRYWEHEPANEVARAIIDQLRVREESARDEPRRRGKQRKKL
jgi:DNA mismatch endonuclease (patch repair protein)